MPKGQVCGSEGFEFKDSKSLGENLGSVISSGVKVGNKSVVSNSLIMSNSIVGVNSHIEQSVIGQNVSIGDSCKILNCVIGDNVIVKSHTSLEGSKLEF